MNTLEQIGWQSNKVLFQFSLTEQRFEFLSDAFQSIWELDKPAVEQDPLLLLNGVVKEDQPAVLRCWDQLLRGDHVEETVKIRQGDWQRYIRCEAYPIRNEKGEIAAVAGMVEDVSSNRQFLDYLIEFGRRKNSALEMVSHDLRGPLAVMKSVAELLRKDIEVGRREEINTYLEIIEEVCVSCTHLINDVLSEEHLRSPEIQVNRTRGDFYEQIRQVVEFYQKAQLVQQRIQLDLPREPLVVAIDQVKFSQILNNLISNSIKFTPANGLITIRAYQEGHDVVLVHQDNGVGIPAQMLPNLFDRHQHVGRKGLNGEESRGLGLSIVHELVLMHGGTISVQSQENAGTTFTVRLPFQGA